MRLFFTFPARRCTDLAGARLSSIFLNLLWNKARVMNRTSRFLTWSGLMVLLILGITYWAGHMALVQDHLMRRVARQNSGKSKTPYLRSTRSASCYAEPGFRYQTEIALRHVRRYL